VDPNEGSNTVSRIDPATNRVTSTYKVGFGPTIINAAFGDLWVTNFMGADVTRIDPDRAR
jgi:YVTN family beta-propeller protein